MVQKTFINVFYIISIQALDFHSENVQSVEWDDCEMFKCATIKIPLSKKSELIELKITKSLAKVQPAEKTLFLDIGSRHQNGTSQLQVFGGEISNILRNKVDLIVVEFRGIQQISCPMFPYNLGKSPSESEMRYYDLLTKSTITSCQRVGKCWNTCRLQELQEI
jgi:hypothetical protein